MPFWNHSVRVDRVRINGGVEMTARKNPKSSAPAAHITHVIVDTHTLAPLALKYPNGLLMTALPSNRALIKQAAQETETAIFILLISTTRGERLEVYATADGVNASTPTIDPIEFFKAFQQLQVDAWKGK